MNDKTVVLDKSPSEYSEEEIKAMFLDMFFWVSENRTEWLEEAIKRNVNKIWQLQFKA